MYIFTYITTCITPTLQETQLKSPTAEGLKARETLKILETLTYSCPSGEALHTLNSSLLTALNELKSHVPNSEGIVVLPAVAKRIKLKSQLQRIRQITAKYSTLQLCNKRGPKRHDSAFRNRVGRRASALRQVTSNLICNNSYAHTCMSTYN